MKKVYKYTLDWFDYKRLMLPVGAQILHFDVQHGEPQIWALVEPEATMIERTFRLAGTGHAITEQSLNHIGSTLMMNGKLVWHLFEIIKEVKE